MTNYEKIKQMSDEELAELLAIAMAIDCAHYCPARNTYKIKNWLNSEVEE